MKRLCMKILSPTSKGTFCWATSSVCSLHAQEQMGDGHYSKGHSAMSINSTVSFTQSSSPDSISPLSPQQAQVWLFACALCKVCATLSPAGISFPACFHTASTAGAQPTSCGPTRRHPPVCAGRLSPRTPGLSRKPPPRRPAGGALDGRIPSHQILFCNTRPLRIPSWGTALYVGCVQLLSAVSNYAHTDWRRFRWCSRYESWDVSVVSCCFLVLYHQGVTMNVDSFAMHECLLIRTRVFRVHEHLHWDWNEWGTCQPQNSSPTCVLLSNWVTEIPRSVVWLSANS